MALVAASLCGAPRDEDTGSGASSPKRRYTVGAQHLLGVHSSLRHLLDTVKFDPSETLPPSDIRDFLKRAYQDDLPLSSIDHHRVPAQVIFARFMVDPFVGLSYGQATERHLLYGATDAGQQQWRRLVKMRCTLPSMSNLKKPKKARKHFQKWESAVKEIEYSSAAVWRGGEISYVKENELVVGDMVFLSPGSKATADIRVVACTHDATADASPIVGDSDPRKVTAEVSMAQILDATNVVLYGSFVLSGCVLGVVFAVGEKSILGGKMSSLDRTSFPEGMTKKEKSAVLLAAAMISDLGVVAKHVPAVMLLPRTWVVVVSVVPALVHQLCSEAPRFVGLDISVVLLFEGAVPEQLLSLCSTMANSTVLTGRDADPVAIQTALHSCDVVMVAKCPPGHSVAIVERLSEPTGDDGLRTDAVMYVGTSMVDSAAVERADLGVSLNEDVATIVTKDAAGIILVKNDIQALASAIEITSRTIATARGRRRRRKKRGGRKGGGGSPPSSPSTSAQRPFSGRRPVSVQSNNERSVSAGHGNSGSPSGESARQKGRRCVIQ